MPIADKIKTIAKEIYGADGVTYDKEAEKTISAGTIFSNANTMPANMHMTPQMITCQGYTIT